MEAALLRRALDRERSLLSSHPLLDPDLQHLAQRCASERTIVHLLLVRAEGETHGAYAVHWINRSRPSYDRRFGFYYYWDIIGLAVAAGDERRRIESEIAGLRQAAFTDVLTGLPNALALEEELHRHEVTYPFAVAVLDFDGMREANAAFGYDKGGDALISAVGHGLARLRRPSEFAARLHTAGDEFAVLLPHVDEQGASLRGAEIEHELDALRLPEDLRSVYHGASVGWACREAGQSAGQAMGQAIVSMRERKRLRSLDRNG
jgi:diguanylate cyclase (GGDEF)-like protein